MKYLFALALVCLLIVPSVCVSQQISPNPNPVGNTITVDTPDRYNGVTFDNNGEIDITSVGNLTNNDTLKNNKGGTLDNAGLLTNYNLLANYNLLTNNDGGSLINDGTLTNESGSTLTNSGSLVNSLGTLTNGGTLNNNGKIISSGAVTNNDTLTNYDGGTLANYDGSTLTNNGSLSNDGMLNIYEGGTLTNNDAVSNNGTLTNDRGGSLNNNEGGTLTNNDGSLINGGTLTNDGTLANYATLTNNDTLINSGMLNIYVGATLINHEGAALTNDATSDRFGTLTIASDSTLANFGALVNSGGLLTNSGTLNNYGEMISSGRVMTNNGTLNNYDGGTLDIAYILKNDDTLTNVGTLSIYDSGVLTNDGTLTKDAGGILVNDGTIFTLTGVFKNAGTLNGTGWIVGDVTDTGMMAPGDGAGVMTIDGDYFKVDGSKEIELGGLFDGGGDHAITEFDWIDVTGNVELAGLLNVSLIDGFEKRINRGQVFEFLRVGGTLSGQYEGLGEGALVGNFGGQDLFITYGGMGDGGGVALFTNAVPEPTTVLIWSMLAGLGMTVRRRR